MKEISAILTSSLCDWKISRYALRESRNLSRKKCKLVQSRLREYRAWSVRYSARARIVIISSVLFISAYSTEFLFPIYFTPREKEKRRKRERRLFQYQSIRRSVKKLIRLIARCFHLPLRIQKKVSPGLLVNKLKRCQGTKARSLFFFYDASLVDNRGISRTSLGLADVLFRAILHRIFWTVSIFPLILV